MAILVYKMPTYGIFDVEFSLAKGIIFTEVGLADGAILNMRVAYRHPRISRDLLPPSVSGASCIIKCFSCGPDSVSGSQNHNNRFFWAGLRPLRCYGGKCWYDLPLGIKGRHAIGQDAWFGQKLKTFPFEHIYSIRLLIVDIYP